MSRELWPFEKAVIDLWHCGFISKPVVHSVNVFFCDCTGVGWAAVCRELAEHLPGMVSVSGNGTGCIWVCGRGGPHGVLIQLPEWERVKAARAIAEEVTGDSYTDVYSVGRCAKGLLSFVAPPHLDCKGKAPKSVERLREGITYGYHNCIPGEYDHLTMWDVKAYYYDMITRLKSLRLTVDDDGVLWEPFTANQKARFKDVTQAIRENKPLRNTLVGVMAGGMQWRPFWTWNKETGRVVKKFQPPRHGPFRGAALLVVHTGTLLCRKECLTSQSVYSTIDCVTLPCGEPCEWTRYGFHVEIKADRTGALASGKAVICQRGSYCIGSVRTEPYKKGITEQLAVHGCGEPPQDFSRYLLEGG